MIKLKKVLAEEVEALLQMVEQYYLYDSIPFKRELSHRALVEMLANPEIGNAYFFQLPGQTAVAGYGIVTVGNDHEVGGKKAFLTDFYFDTTYRGQGFGFQALELIEEQCRLQGIQALELQVLTSNPRAHALYTKSGYKAYERIPMIKVF